MTSSQKIIFIIGILQRSGTNFLAELLKKHDDLAYCKQPSEDFYLYHSNELKQYIDKTASMWNPRWQGMDIDQYHSRLKQIMSNALREGLIGDIKSPYVLTKTPMSFGLDNFNHFFNTDRLIILLRDGRNVVDSNVKSFNLDYKDIMMQWADSAKRILAFINENGHQSENHIVIKYEDLHENTNEILKQTFQQLSINDSAYHFDEVDDVPIIGSSRNKDEKGNINWSNNQTDKSNFNPNQRYDNWDNNTKKMYNKICGKLANELGYESFDVKRSFF